MHGWCAMDAILARVGPAEAGPTWTTNNRRVEYNNNDGPSGVTSFYNSNYHHMHSYMY